MDLTSDIPLAEFDPEQKAVIEPSQVVAAVDVPARAVMCFFAEVIETLCREQGAREVARLTFEHGTSHL